MSSFVKLVAEPATFHDKYYLAGVREIVNERLFVFTETASHPGMWSTRDTGASAKRE